MSERELIGDGHGILTPEEISKLSDTELTHRFVEIADRGFVSLRLQVPMSDDWHGEWVSNDPAAIAEARLKGFVIDDKFAPKYGLHSDGTGKPIIGDVIHMICPKRIKQAHDNAAKIRFERIHGKTKNLPEETQFEDSVKQLGLGTKHKGLDINTSTQQKVNQSELLQAVKGGS